MKNKRPVPKDHLYARHCQEIKLNTLQVAYQKTRNFDRIKRLKFNWQRRSKTLGAIRMACELANQMDVGTSAGCRLQRSSALWKETP
jgi:hypothetical protein